MPISDDKPRFFRNAAEFRKWLEKHHASAKELWVGMYRKDSGKQTMSWKEAVDEALCFGWIDGVRRSVDEISFTNRFTPRKPTSNWSAINLQRVKELTAEGRMRPAGEAAYQKRDVGKAGAYSFERDGIAFSPAQEKTFRSNKKAWSFWQSQPPGYRRIATWWVISAKQPATRERRLKILIDDSANGLRIKMLRRAWPHSRERGSGAGDGRQRRRAAFR